MISTSSHFWSETVTERNIKILEAAPIVKDIASMKGFMNVSDSDVEEEAEKVETIQGKLCTEESRKWDWLSQLNVLVTHNFMLMHTINFLWEYLKFL